MKFKKFLSGSQLAHNPWFKRLMVAGFLFLMGQALVIVLSFSYLPSSLPLFYSRPWGTAQLASKITLWLFPFLTTIVFIFNLVLAHLLFTAERILSTILIVSATVFAFLTLFTQIKIVLLFY